MENVLSSKDATKQPCPLQASLIWQYHFDFNVEELAIVEDAMRYRLRRLTSRRATVVKESSKVKIDAEVTQISSLLGKIHNQKVFYTPKAGFVGGG